MLATLQVDNSPCSCRVLPSTEASVLAQNLAQSDSTLLRVILPSHLFHHMLSETMIVSNPCCSQHSPRHEIPAGQHAATVSPQVLALNANSPILCAAMWWCTLLSQRIDGVRRLQGLD